MAELALSLANWATRLAEVMQIVGQLSRNSLSLATRADPPRRSDVNSGSGVAELALSRANWADRLAEVM